MRQPGRQPTPTPPHAQPCLPLSTPSSLPAWQLRGSVQSHWETRSTSISNISQKAAWPLAPPRPPACPSLVCPGPAAVLDPLQRTWGGGDAIKGSAGNQTAARQEPPAQRPLQGGHPHQEGGPGHLFFSAGGRGTLVLLQGAFSNLSRRTVSLPHCLPVHWQNAPHLVSQPHPGNTTKHT